MERVIKYTKNYHVDLNDVDFKQELKLSALFGYFQDVANLAAENLGVGINQLVENYGVAFVLMRMRVDLDRNPKLDEKITIETWPLEPGKLEFERHFIVTDQKGEVIGRAVSVWVIMDLKKRRLRRSDSINLEYPEIIEDKALDVELRKLKTSENLETVYHKTIGYSDIDFNGHLNNARYVDFIMDCFPLEEHKLHNTSSIEVNYLNESLPGDTLILKKDLSQLEENIVIVEGISAEDEKTVFRSRLKILDK